MPISCDGPKHLQIHLRTSTPTHPHTHARTYSHTRTHTHTHTHTLSHTHTHTQRIICITEQRQCYRGTTGKRLPFSHLQQTMRPTPRLPRLYTTRPFPIYNRPRDPLLDYRISTPQGHFPFTTDHETHS